MNQISRTLTLFLLFLLASACSRPAAVPSPATPTPQRITSESVVKAQGLAVEISGGDSHEATVRVTISPGYHINANPPTFPYLKATTLELSPIDGVSIGSVTYPKPLLKKFAFAEAPLAVYEGATELKVNLKTDKTAPNGERSLPATLRIQACDDQVCYPPGKLQLSIPVTKK